MSQSPGNQSHCTPRLFSFGNYREASQKGFNVFSIQDVGWKPECLNYQVLNLSTSPHKVFHGHCSLTVCFSALKMSAPVRGLGTSASGWTTSLTYLYLTIYLLRFEIVPVSSLSQSKRKPSDVWLVVPSWSLSSEQIIFHISDIFHISGKSSPMFINFIWAFTNQPYKGCGWKADDGFLIACHSWQQENECCDLMRVQFHSKQVQLTLPSIWLSRKFLPYFITWAQV